MNEFRHSPAHSPELRESGDLASAGPHGEAQQVEYGGCRNRVMLACRNDIVCWEKGSVDFDPACDQ